MAVPGLDAHPIDSSTKDSDVRADLNREIGTAMGRDDEPDNDGDEDEDVSELLYQRAVEAEGQSITFNTSGVRDRWIRSIKATRNEHFDGSKYLSESYKHRSKLFRPKTRNALRKKLTNAAHAFFATGDVISVKAMDEVDQMKVAAAQLKQEVLNYRLSRSSRRNGIRWFQTCMGACHNASTYGIVVSKQSWRYREEPGAANDDGTPVVLEDRPFIELLRVENVRIDMNCDWTDPAQSSQYLGLIFPMTPDEAWSFIEAKSNIEWLDGITYESINAAAMVGPSDGASNRAAREGGKDVTAQASVSFRPLWLTEWFVRHKGVDYVFWMAKNKPLSKPKRVRDIYPHMEGARPVVFGVGSLEPHVVYPMSPVDSWQMLQQEINDQANLRIDHMRKVVEPPMKVKRGKNVDGAALKVGGPNKLIYMSDTADVETMVMPDLPNSAYQENNTLNSDFDDAAAIFNSGSVQTNRQMNETVGGMRLMAGSSDAVAEFDLTIFVETWAEVVVWQLMKLEEYYETDAIVLAVCGEKAQLWQRYGLDSVTDEMMRADTEVTINLGVGANNVPQDKLQKLQMAAGAAMQILMPFVQGGIIQAPKPNAKAIIDECFGAASFKDGGERFFTFIPDEHTPPPEQQQQQDPKAQAAMMQAQTKQQELGFKAKQHGDTMQLKGAELQGQQQQHQTAAALQARKQELDHEISMAKLQDAERQRQADIVKEQMRAHAEMVAAQADAHHDRAGQIIGHVADRRAQHRQHSHEYLLGLMDHHARNADREAGMEQAKMAARNRASA